jgi:hypothetical protein
VLNAQTASYVLTAQTASFVANAQSASNAVTAQTASYANSFTVGGTLTAQTLVVQTITSSVDFVTGSTRFGSLLDNTHVFSGSVTINPGGGLFVSSSGFVGIGTTNPSAPLQIRNSNGTLLTLTRVGATNANWSFVHGDSSGGYLQLYNNTSTSSSLYIRDTGNVGIGTNNPAVALDVNGYARATGIGLNVTPLSIGTSQNYIRFTNTGGDFYVGQEGSSAGAFFNGSKAYDNVLYSNNPYNFIIGGGSAMYINSSGYVGINTNNPTQLLHLSSSSTSSTGIQLTLGSEARSHYLVSTTPNTAAGRDLGLLAWRSLTLKSGNGVGEGEIYVNAFENIYLNTSSSYTTRMFVSSSGLVGIGTTTPSTKVHIYESATSSTAYLTIQNNRARNAAVQTTTTSGSFIAGTSIGTDTFNYQIYDGVAGSARLTISSTGAATFSSTIYTPNFISSDTEFRLGAAFARVATLDAGGGFGGGYNLNWNNGSPIHNSTGTISGYAYANDGSVRFYANTSNAANTSALLRFNIGSDGSIAMGNFSPSGTPTSDYRSFEIGRQGNTIAGAPWKSNLYLSTNATITAGSTTFTYRNSGTVASFFGLEGGEMSFSNASSGTAGNTVSFAERMRITSGGTIFHKQWFGGSISGGYSLIGTISPGNTGNRYLHVRINTINAMMYWIKVLGYQYIAGIIEGLGGGYIDGGTGGVSQGYLSGSIVAMYQNSNYLEIVVDTISTSTSNRWGSITFFGGTDIIATVQALEIMAYSWTSTTTRVY